MTNLLDIEGTSAPFAPPAIDLLPGRAARSRTRAG